MDALTTYETDANGVGLLRFDRPDARIEEGAIIDRGILDKEVVVGRRGQVGWGDDYQPNQREPERLREALKVVAGGNQDSALDLADRGLLDTDERREIAAAHAVARAYLCELPSELFPQGVSGNHRGSG